MSGPEPGRPAPGGATAGVSRSVFRDRDELVRVVAARLVEALAGAQAAHGSASVVLTGGRVAADVYRTVRERTDRDSVDWSRVDVWWGDERFLPAGHPDRNETQARAALLDALPLDPARVHPMPADDGPDGADPQAAAQRYAQALAGAAGPDGDLPRFDVLLLGVGEDGHVASVFPGHPVTGATEPVAAVRDSPKPPPVRITLTLPAIGTAGEVWLVAAGADKAGAVRLALTEAGADAVSADAAAPGAWTGTAGALPAAVVRGVDHTHWFLDREAVPPGP
ncbi:6-phosphogluconolactonase [Polymorphospora rubra]|uniref:6-phosphogluconolactonase n=1 Tax=Polymorphospora rubra TaxID=338584 RepID=A0A810MPQ0_9ACTN|nr:6-phosphogluconolactonase [Polymorphospora rubra]